MRESHSTVQLLSILVWRDLLHTHRVSWVGGVINICHTRELEPETFEVIVNNAELRTAIQFRNWVHIRIHFVWCVDTEILWELPTQWLIHWLNLYSQNNQANKKKRLTVNLHAKWPRVLSDDKKWNCDTLQRSAYPTTTSANVMNCQTIQIEREIRTWKTISGIQSLSSSAREHAREKVADTCRRISFGRDCLPRYIPLTALNFDENRIRS